MFNKILIPKPIAPFLLLVFFLTILRVAIFGKYSLIFILWNILLSFIPLLVSTILVILKNNNKLKDWTLLVLGIVWLLFLPNAPYIVTDLMHIGVVRAVPALYDSVLLFSSALVGVLFGLYSVSDMEKILASRFSFFVSKTIIFLVMILTGFGIYLGRFLRFNSWDVFVNPSYLINAIRDIFSNKADLIEALTYTSLFGVFIIVVYWSWSSRNK